MTKLVLVGEAWGAEEEKLRHPFVGVSGVELLRQLDDSGLMPLTPFDKSMIASFWNGRDPTYTKLVWSSHPEVKTTNVFNFRPAGNDIKSLCGSKKDTKSTLSALSQGKYLYPKYEAELHRLYMELGDFKPNLAVALGSTPLWALCGTGGITKRRGAIVESTKVPGLKVLPVFHPAGILRQWENRPVTILDLEKARYEQEFPEIRRPKRTVYVDPSLEDLRWFEANHIASARAISADIETAAGQVTCIGFATSPDRAIVVPFVDYRRSDRSYWRTAEEEIQAWAFVCRVLDHPAPKIFQNGLYDIHFLWRAYGLKVRNAEHDTMLLHHSLQPESPKGLGFLGSVYTNEAAWKLWRGKGNETTKRDDA